ncbi:hypothetical protein KKC60_05100 [Patescibacteria group bacterium]|nr:hypothetical protein [Patescibacteria group bacterium]
MLPEKLGRKILKKHQPKVVLIIGDARKSKTQSLCQNILSKKFEVRSNDYSAGDNYQNVLKTVLGVKSNHSSGLLRKGLKTYFGSRQYPDILLLNLWLKRPGETKKVLDFFGQVDLVLLTSVLESPDYKNNFKSDRSFQKEVKEILGEKNKVKLFAINSDDERLKKTLNRFKGESVRIGLDQSSSFKMEGLSMGTEGIKGASFKLNYDNSHIPIRIPWASTVDDVYSSLFSAYVGVYFGLNLVQISRDIEIADFQKKEQK